MIRAAFLIYDSDGRVLQRTLRFQINPDSLNRTIQPQSVGGDSGDRLEALRFKGPPVETIKFKANFDTAQMLNDPEYSYAATHGLHPLLAATAPLILFSWGPKRLVPVRITDIAIAETTFDPDLNPVLVESMDLGLRVLS